MSICATTTTKKEDTMSKGRSVLIKAIEDLPVLATFVSPVTRSKYPIEQKAQYQRFFQWFEANEQDMVSIITNEEKDGEVTFYIMQIRKDQYLVVRHLLTDGCDHTSLGTKESAVTYCLGPAYRVCEISRGATDLFVNF